METKQTAVLYLYEEIDRAVFNFLEGITTQMELSVEITNAKNKALQMEREQIIDAYNSARNDHHQMYFADEYFHKTYGGQDE